MQATDIVDFFEASLIFLKFSQEKITNLRPIEISGRTGYRFEFEAFDRNGMAKRGTVLAYVDDKDQLNMVIYSAAKLHYYDLYIDDVEKILSSIKII